MNRIRDYLKKKFVSLNFKLAIVVVIAMAVTLGVYLFSSWFEDFVADRQYLSEEADVKAKFVAGQRLF